MRRFLLAMLIFCGVSAVTAADALCIIRNGAFTRSGYWLRRERNTPASPEGVVFNGKDSVVWIKLNKFSTPMRSFSVAAELVIDELPATGTACIAVRPGYHNIFGIDSTGRVNFSVYAADRKSRQVVFSRTKLKPGERVRLAGVLERIDDGEYDVVLYVNEVAEGKATLYGEPFPYDQDYFYLGGVGMKQEGMFFRGKILNLWAAESGLSRDEINRLK